MNADQSPFLDPNLPIDVRISDLLARLTPEEKISQLRHESPGIERLGIPAYNWWSEALHGVSRNGNATVFPQAIGLAATWDVELIECVATAISDEARAKHHAAAARGCHKIYQGLTFWSPNINILRDGRWGRGQETWGEDPFLTGELGAAFVRGLQGNDLRYLKTAACAKHYAVHSGPEAERHTFNACPPKRDFRETYLPAFKRLVDEGVESVMGAYNRTYDDPCCGSTLLIQEILRGEWGFKGHYVSDCWAIQDFHEHHKVTQRPEESAAKALKTGCDLICGAIHCSALPDALMLGLVSIEDIDRALTRLLRTRFKLGMFDPLDQVPYSSIGLEVVRCPEHIELSRKAAARSIVLLKNANSALPIKKGEGIYLMGPNASSIDVLLGSYYGLSSKLVTILEGIASRIEEGQSFDYRPAFLLDRPKAIASDWAAFEAARADVVVVAMGLSAWLEGEEGDAIMSTSQGDRTALELPPSQEEYFLRMAAKVRESNPKIKIVTLIFSGSPVSCPAVHDASDAVLQVWYPGEQGGNAVADVLFGSLSPSGRMPVTAPKATADLPEYRDYAMRGRTYRFAEKESLYPFGFGLSYTRFAYESIELTRPTLARGEDLPVKVKLANIGKSTGTEIVQLYLEWLDAPVPTPHFQLIGFQPVELDAGANASVNFTITPGCLTCYDEDGKAMLHAGRYRLYAGGSSPLPESQKLGAPAMVTSEFSLDLVHLPLQDGQEQQDHSDLLLPKLDATVVASRLTAGSHSLT